MVQVVQPDVLALGGSYMTSRVAAAARKVGVLAIERVPCLPVIELIAGRFPLDDVELRAQVLRVAPNAVLVPGKVLRGSSVEAPLICEPQPDFCVATGAFKFSFAQPKGVAGGAVNGTLEALVRLRERTRGDLSLNRQASEAQQTA